MLRRFLGYLRPDMQILLVPHREGMLIFEGRQRQRLNPEVARLIEHFANHPGEVVTHEDAANVLWPGCWPDDWHKCVCRRVAEMRQVLPPNFISTERNAGYRLIQEIKVEALG